MGQKGHVIDLKGLKMYEKRPKNGVFLTYNTCFLVESSLAELGGTPPPLTEKNLAPKTLSVKGEYPTPLKGIRELLILT